MDPSHTVAGYHDVLPGSAPAPAPEREHARAAAPEMKILLGIVIATFAIAALYVGKDVFIPITLAVFLSFVLSPLVNRLQRWRLWRGLAVFLSVVGALGVIGVMGLLIGSQTASLAQEAPRYAQTIETKVKGVESFASSRLNAITSRLGMPLPPVASGPDAAPSAPQATASNQVKPAPQPTTGSSASPLTIARTLLGPLLGPLETAVIVFVVSIFVLMQKEDLRDRFVRLFGADDLHRTTLALDDASQRLSRYFLAQFCVNSGFGLVIGLGLWMIGIPSAAMWGVLAGLLRFVPYIGSFLAALAPVALAAAIEPNWTAAFEVMALFAVCEPLTGYVLEPLLYGHSTGLSPISVIVAALFWTWLWGPVGLIMSTPLTLCMVVTGRHVKAMEFFDILFGDRPALTPVEVFYQRLLAAHGDAMLTCARQALTTSSVLDFYDDVVLPSLRCAAQDHARGVITPDRLAAMQDGLRMMVAAIEDRAEEGSVEILRQAPILCVPGDGPFDGLVADMLVQTLQRNGHPTELANPADGDEADAQSTTILCFANPAASSDAQRSLVDRWARGQACVAVGFWEKLAAEPRRDNAKTRPLTGFAGAIALVTA